MKTARISAARFFPMFIICWASLVHLLVAGPLPTVQTGIAIPDRFRHAEQFIRTLEAGGLVVQSIAQSTLEASFGGGQNAAYITTNMGVVEVIVFPGQLDAEQLRITYTKWNGNQHHYYIDGLTVRAPEDMYGQAGYFTLYKNWFIQTREPELDGAIKRILGQSKE